MLKSTLSGFSITTFLLSCASILLLSSCSQLFSAPEELNDKGYHLQAERDLSKGKDAEISRPELLVALYGQQKYIEANELLAGMNQPELLANPQTKDIVLSLRRIAGNYETTDLAGVVNQSEIEQFYTWPSNNSEERELEMVKTELTSQNESFTGLHIDQEKGKAYLGKHAKKEDLGVTHYSIQEVSFKDNALTNKWTNSIDGADKDRIYNSSPTIDSKDQLYFSMNLFDGISMNPAKMEAWNKETMVNYLGIFSTTAGNSKTVIPLPENINKKGSDNTHPHILNDTILFFTSDRAEKGNMDIHYSILQSGIWSDPQSLSVNSPQNDVLPVSDGNYLYFSSRGHNNFGGLDVFRSKLNFANGKITTGPVENMMQPFNSSSDDMMAFMLTESTGYMATNRNSDEGDEIYFFKLDNSKRLASNIVGPDGNSVEGDLTVFVKNESGQWMEEGSFKSNSSGRFEGIQLKEEREYKLDYSSPGLKNKSILVSATDDSNPSKREQELLDIEEVNLDGFKSMGVVKDRISDEEIGGVDITLSYINSAGQPMVKKYTNSEDGKWNFPIPSGKQYELTFSKDGYEDRTIKLASAEEVLKLNEAQLIQMSKKGDKINISNVYFDYNSAVLKEESFPVLDNIVQFLNDRPNITVELGAHTDSRGSDYYNLKLSEKRALTCYSYLILNKIHPSRITFKGYGETQLLNKCKNGVACSENEHFINRRMELKILSE